MPTYQTAKQVAENALRVIGAFPASRSQADPGELSIALTWLEMVMNHMSGSRAMAGMWQIVDIRLEAGIGDYLLSDFADDAGVQRVFSAFLVKGSQDPVPLDIVTEPGSIAENLSETGTPERVTITRARDPQIKFYPTPTSANEDNGDLVRIRLQTFHTAIDPTGTAGVDIALRPSWYLWLTTLLAYYIGSGPVRAIAEGELKRLKVDSSMMLQELTGNDGQYNTGEKNVTQPMAGSYS